MVNSVVVSLPFFGFLRACFHACQRLTLFILHDGACTHGRVIDLTTRRLRRTGHVVNVLQLSRGSSLALLVVLFVNDEDGRCNVHHGGRRVVKEKFT